MKASKKNVIKFNYCGVMFELPATCLKTKSYWGKELENPIIEIGRKEVPLMFKQYVKAKHPELLVWGKSQTFAGGCSSDLYACYADGSEIEYQSELYRELNSFCNSFSGGHFDGMHDIYEYGENGKTDNGTEIEFGAKYVSFNGKAPYGTWPEAKRSLKAMLAGEYVWGVLTLEQAIEKLKSYSYTESVIQKAVQSI